MLSASDRAYAHVKAGILDGTRSGGQFFTEGQIAEAVGISRTPVREALLRLEMEGLVMLLPKKGAIVVPVSAQEARDVVEARAVIEQWAATRMWPRRKEILDDLGGLLEVMRTARRAGIVEDFVAADGAFHECIVAAAGNAILTRHYRLLLERQLCISHVVRRVSFARMDRAITSHREMVGLLAAGTKADFLAATQEHLLVAQEQAGRVP